MSFMPIRAGDRRALALAGAILALAAPRLASASCAVNEGDKDGNGTNDVRIVGTAAKQNATLEIHASGDVVKVDCDGNGLYTDPGDIVQTLSSPVEVYSLELGGADNIAITLGEDMVGQTKDIVLALGPMGSTVTFQTLGHALTGSSLQIELIGSDQVENVTLDFTGSAISSSSVVIHGDLQGGNDNFKIVDAASTTDSIFDVGVRMGFGNNVANFVDGGGVVSNSTLAIHLDGDDTWTAYDSFLSTFSGQIQDNSRVLYKALLNAGNDRYTGNFDVATFGIDPVAAAGSEVRFTIKGQVGFDGLVISDMGHTGPAKINGLFDAYLDGGGQQDILKLNWAGGVTGTGEFRVWADGGESYDHVTFTLNADASSQNVLSLFGNGGPENDLGSPNGDFVNMTINNYGSATYGPGGAVFLDGGLDGIDTCNATGNALFLTMNCEAGSW